MPAIIPNLFSESLITFLRHSYKFVDRDWQHIPRDMDPDQGFEKSFRARCVQQLTCWTVSHQREMRLGMEAETLSGALHEIDLVVQDSETLGIAELKNRQGCPPDKNDIIIFFAKLLDYLVRNPSFLLREISPIFMSATIFEISGLAACLGLGIHPIAPGLRPIPVLLDTAKRIDFDVRQEHLSVPTDLGEDLDDLYRRVNQIAVAINDTWISSRLGCLSEDKMLLKATGNFDTYDIAEQLRKTNSDCTLLLSRVRELKKMGQS